MNLVKMLRDGQKTSSHKIFKLKIMGNLIELNKEELQEIHGGKKEWVLLGCLLSPVAAAFAVGFYLEYNS